MELSKDESNTVWKLLKELEVKKGITEVVINNIKNVFVEREGQFIALNVALREEDIYQFVQDIAKFNKKLCSEEFPMLDGNLPDGSRINIILPPLTKECPAITIRKYLKSIVSLEKTPTIFGLNKKWVTFIKALVSAKVNIIVSGGTGAGKTTLLNLLLAEVDSTQRIITIEDTSELVSNAPNTVGLEASKKQLASELDVTMRDLVKNALRMRPDRIVVGEVRGGELFDLLLAMNTGHEGSFSSIHANSPVDCLSRMETLYLLSGNNLPNKVVRGQIQSAVDFIIQLTRTRGGERVITRITELTGMENGMVLTHNVASYSEGKLAETGITPKCMQRLHTDGGLAMNFFKP
ncbi:MAG: CpaF family protein [Bacteriovoracaceae bacterium]|nr:CpaF family protein [Bacteriovoracaceae bacterium]